MKEQALKMYLKDLLKLEERALKKLEKEIKKHEDKLKNIVEEYEDLRGVEEAYAYGYITEKKREKLIKKREKLILLFENLDKAKEYKSPTGQYIKMLQKDIEDIKIELKIISDI